MRKFHHAIICYYVSKFDTGFHHWLILLSGSIKTDGLISKKTDRAHLAKWITDLFTKQVSFDSILQLLAGDTYLEQNKTDVQKIKEETGKNVIELWDTDPIFLRYPHLKTMARNKEFETWYKSAQKQK